MKGRIDEAEIAKTRSERGKLLIHPLQVPGLDAERHLLQFKPAIASREEARVQ
ncbi:hypothetical protein [Alkalilimnicola ehrlichii]|uniref:hypothetical protein n=1 Tax=Alkalilimnicola ehrlichii TaxID=351052 RepID=UPI002162F463|nr:hypothetical protein [Alkalilimnicola ehrlichii]